MDEDLQLVSSAKRGDQLALNQLIAKYRPIIANSASRFRSAPIPVAAVQAAGINILIEAVGSFSPGHGTTFRTHLGNMLKGLNRYVNTNKAVARIPESIQSKLVDVLPVQAELRRGLGREPSAEEIADKVSIHQDTIAKMISSTQRKEVSYHSMVEDLSAKNQTRLNETLAFLRSTLMQEDKEILDELTKPGTMTVAQISQKLKVSESRVRYMQTRLSTVLQQSFSTAF